MRSSPSSAYARERDSPVRSATCCQDTEESLTVLSQQRPHHRPRRCAVLTGAEQACRPPSSWRDGRWGHRGDDVLPAVLVPVPLSREERVARNETTTRQLNEQIEQAHQEAPTQGHVRVLCECGQQDCDHAIAMTLAEYESVRADPRQFAVARDHVLGEVERVVTETDRYAVVVKREGTPAAWLVPSGWPRDPPGTAPSPTLPPGLGKWIPEPRWDAPGRRSRVHLASGSRPVGGDPDQQRFVGSGDA